MTDPKPSQQDHGSVKLHWKAGRVPNVGFRWQLH